MKFINELREGERVGEIYLCKQKQSAEIGRASCRERV